MRQTSEQIGGMTVHARYLTNLPEAVRIMESVLKRGATRLGEASLEVGNGGWSGTHDLPEAIAQARYGWPKGRGLRERAMASMTIDHLVGQRLTVESFFDFAGDEPDVGRYLDGEPDNMIDYSLRYDRGGKIANLLVNIGTSCDRSAGQIMRRGMAVMMAHDILTANGYSLGITAAEAAHNHARTQTEYYVPIVCPGDHIDADVLTFCMASPAFLRRLVFALNDNETDKLRESMGFYSNKGYGYPTNIKTPLPPHTIMIGQDEGMGMGEKDVPAYAEKIAERAMDLLK